MKSYTPSRSRFTRRNFLGTAVKAASAAVIGHSIFSPDIAFGAGPFVRRDIGGMSASDPILLSYRKAIKAMKLLPLNNPLSWAYQAAIHGTTATPIKTAWNTCTHGSYFFWSWHRMYLYWFERIIRKMSGDMCWALPYWNWTSATERNLPVPFRDTASELYTPNRNSAINSGAGSLTASAVNYGSAFSSVNFTSASSSLEGTPHGAVHVQVGGWMGSVPTAAQDPIFYLHHCNIDRLWNLWLAQGGGRSDPLTDNTWKNTKFTFFDENGSQVKMTGCDVLRATQQLSYAYEGEPAEINLFCQNISPNTIGSFETVRLQKLPIPELTLNNEPVWFALDISEIRERLLSINKDKSQTLLLEFNEVVAERQPGVIWEVYLGLPEGDKAIPESANYVGNVALFGAGIRNEAHHGFTPAHFAFPIGRALTRALDSKQDHVQVTFIPQGVLIDGKPSRPEVQSPVRIGEATLSVETEKRR